VHKVHKKTFFFVWLLYEQLLGNKKERDTKAGTGSMKELKAMES